ncbi:hypothetical protein GCM10010412_066650 [Nonomuraea recticatena]|uniref:Major facilitator superfamily (MFS) profile domain-containing protein n=1 Tax=Nonomuraea recticatena TaxID=46178 RepID=A0ABN3SPW2_9ACTN
MSLPSTINVALSSAPMEDMGVASGANNAMRELGGVFGVAFLGAMFAANRGYATPAAAIDGFRAALFLGGAMALVGMIIAMFAPGRRPGEAATPAAPEPKVAKAGG